MEKSMKERPILFNGPMVRALLDGSKTQTRREFKAKNGGVWPHKNDLPGMRQILRTCPYGQPGDRLWVREAWTTRQGLDSVPPREISLSQSIGYLADTHEGPWLGKARPSIHMPRWASRITLEITGVRVERLQDISEADAQAEGCSIKNSPADFLTTYKRGYKDLWESINGPGSWDANPWVWVVEFRRLP